MFRRNFERDFGGGRVVWKIHYGVVCVLCVLVCVRVCVCCMCVTSTYSGADMNPEHTHIHILMQRLMYVEVCNIMVLNPNVPDLNKHEQTPNVAKRGHVAGRIPGNTL